MHITKTAIKIRDIASGYHDDKDGGVFAADGKLVVRPKFQREFVYNDKQRDAVIHTVRNGFPLNVIYWSKNDDGTFEILDGQQRTISICQYVAEHSFSIDHQYFFNLTKEEQEQILDYELDVYICEGTEAEKLEWFKVINIAGAVLTPQELLNATYTGPWLSDAKNYFSKRSCPAGQMGTGYVKGNPIRQDLLEKALAWIADRDGLPNGQEYMALHQHDADANDLWLYFDEVISWAKRLFPTVRKGITDSQEWGLLFNQYHSSSYNSNTLETEIKRLVLDDDVTKKAGIIGYILSNKTKHDEKLLSIRTFTESQKLRAYERQNHRCPRCVADGDMTEYAYEEMQGDHIIPWSQGGRTTDDNLQMLCQHCNNDKSDD